MYFQERRMEYQYISGKSWKESHLTVVFRKHIMKEEEEKSRFKKFKEEGDTSLIEKVASKSMGQKSSMLFQSL